MLKCYDFVTTTSILPMASIFYMFIIKQTLAGTMTVHRIEFNAAVHVLYNTMKLH